MNITASEYAAMEQKLADLCREQEMLGSAFNGLSAQQIVQMSASIRDQIEDVMITIFDDLMLERESWRSEFPGHELAQVLEYARLGKQILDQARTIGSASTPTLSLVTNSEASDEAVSIASSEETDLGSVAGTGSGLAGELNGTGYAGTDPTPQMVKELEAQLSELCSEFELLDQHFPGQNAQEIVTRISGQVARLEALYRQVS